MARTFYLLGLLLLLSTCKKADDRPCIKGSGDAITETRHPGAFHSLMLYDDIDYDLIQDSTDKVVIECGENLVNFVSTEIDNGVLSIRDENSCHWLRSLPVKIKVRVHFTQLASIRNEGSGILRTVGAMEQEVIVFDNYHSASENYLEIKAQEATIRINAGGPVIEVKGESHHVNLRNSGIGKLHAEELVSHSVWADNQGHGTIRTTVDGGLFWYLLDGYGDIYYRGEVEEYIEVSRTGEGELILME
ncbi:MAG: hypothetical protein HKN79_01520 [Flavobacteriales bacterium]|nr:hypothetical protein [Flavobacteriales bacterium]